jgi:hypothetical protein
LRPRGTLALQGGEEVRHSLEDVYVEIFTLLNAENINF